MDNNHSFFKFMKDIISSGVWAGLSAAARALYPVLCSFSDETFKVAWPGTDELLRLTGFKTKKSLQEAKKELVSNGLIDFTPGNGRTSTRYYFRFDYTNSKIDLNTYRDTTISRRVRQGYTPEVEESNSQSTPTVSPNQIYININQDKNIQNQAVSDSISSLEYFFRDDTPHALRTHIIQKLQNQYDAIEIEEAIRIAIGRNKAGDIRYLEGILRNRKDSPSSTVASHVNSRSPMLLIQQKLPENLKVYAKALKFHYQSGKTFYFTSNQDIPDQQIVESLKAANFNIKIFKQTG